MKARTATFAGCWLPLGIAVLRLVRVAIGPLALGQLAKGSGPSALTRDEKQGSLGRSSAGEAQTVTITALHRFLPTRR